MSSSKQLPLISIAHYSKFFQFHRDESQKIIFSRFFFFIYTNLHRMLHRTAVFVDGSTPTSVEETGSKSGAMLDSLIQGLIYERQTGNYFNAFLQNSGNEVL